MKEEKKKREKEEEEKEEKEKEEREKEEKEEEEEEKDKDKEKRTSHISRRSSVKSKRTSTIDAKNSPYLSSSPSPSKNKSKPGTSISKRSVSPGSVGSPKPRTAPREDDCETWTIHAEDQIDRLQSERVLYKYI